MRLASVGGRPLLVLVLLAGTILAVPVQAAAQTQPAIRLDRYRMGDTPEDGFALRRPDDLGHLRFGVQLAADYALNPLVYQLTQGDPSSEQAAVVEHQLALQTGLALGLFDRLVIFGGLVVNPVLQGQQVEGQPRADGASLGDAQLGVRVRLFGESEDVVAMAVSLTGTAPSARWARFQSRFAGDEFFTLLPQAQLEVRALPILRVTANLGALIRERQFFGTLDVGSTLTFGLGVTVSAVPGVLDVLAEVVGSSAFRDFFSGQLTPVEGILGVRAQPVAGLHLGLAAGTGFTRAYGSPDLRVIATVGYALPEREDPEADADGDGVPDALDVCPEEPEDPDGFQDEDGCPEADNDGDGVSDLDDLCPVSPEDADGYVDDDGCPEEDADADTVPDPLDICPLVPGVSDCDGCPAEACASGPAPLSPPPTGALAPPPTVAPSTHAGGRPRFEVFFDEESSELRPDQLAVLEAVLEHLRTYPESRLLVEGHADDRGSQSFNYGLSRRRAFQVMLWLDEHGINRRRLMGVGCGERYPQSRATGEPDHDGNRRVELYVVGRVFNVGYPQCR
ncbi:MAG: OmpA family protein [Sandaracinaceae bacterium]